MSRPVNIALICPTCGNTRHVLPIEVRLVLTDWKSWVLFRCDDCGQVEREMRPDQVALLVGARVRTIRHTCEPHAGPKLTYDDLLDFVLGLEADDSLAELAP